MGLFTSYSELRRLRKRLSEVERQLETERARHLIREDALVNVALTAHGHRGVSEPSIEPPKKEKPPLEAQPLSAEDEATLSYYKECARDAGMSEEMAEKWFRQYLDGEEPLLKSDAEQ